MIVAIIRRQALQNFTGAIGGEVECQPSDHSRGEEGSWNSSLL
jgi:hypothetical protein